MVVLVSALSFLSAVPMFALLEPTIRDGLNTNGVSLETALPLGGVSDWLVGTPMIFYLVSLVALYFPLRAEIKKTEDAARLGGAEATAAFLVFVSLGVPVYLATISTVFAQGTVVLPRGWMDIAGLLQPSSTPVTSSVSTLLLVPGLAISLVMGGLYSAAMNAAHRRQRAMGLYPAPLVRTVAVISLLLSLGMIVWAINLSYSHTLYLRILSALVGLVVITANVVLVVKLFRVPKQPPSHQSPYTAVAILNILLSPVLVNWATNLPPFGTILVGLALVIADAILIVNLLRLPKQLSSNTITPRLRLAFSQLIHTGLGAIVVAVIPPVTAISTIVGMGLITNQLVEVLAGYEFAAQEFTLVDLVRNVYLDQASAFLATFVAATAIIGLLTLIISGIIAIPEQLAAQSAQEVRGIEP